MLINDLDNDLPVEVRLTTGIERALETLSGVIVHARNKGLAVIIINDSMFIGPLALLRHSVSLRDLIDIEPHEGVTH